MALVRKAAPPTTFVNVLINRRVIGGGDYSRSRRSHIPNSCMFARANVIGTEGGQGSRIRKKASERAATRRQAGRAAAIPTDVGAEHRPPPSVSRGAAAGTLRTVERL